MLRLNREELAWAAGFFDGEGTACAQDRIVRGHRCTSLALAVSQAGDDAPGILERFRAAVGGLGKVYATRSKKAPAHWKQAYSWRVSSFESAQAVTAMLWQWLGPRKRAQCETALLEFLTRPRSRMTRARGRAMAAKRWARA